MSQNITEAMINMVTANLKLGLQRQGSKLKDLTTIQPCYGETAKLIDTVAPIAARQLTGRHIATVYGNAQHDSRHIVPLTWACAELVSEVDQLKILIDPVSAYATSLMYGMGRALDERIVQGLIGPALRGKNGTATVNLPSAQIIPHGNTNLTLAKLFAIKQQFLLNDVDLNTETITILISPNQLMSLLNTTEVKSADYNQVRSLYYGDVDTFMGMRFITFTGLPITSGTRTCIAFVKSGVVTGMWDSTKVRIDELPQQNYDIAIYAKSTFNATRTFEQKVMRIDCRET